MMDMYKTLACRNCKTLCLLEDVSPIRRKNEKTGYDEFALLCKECIKRKDELFPEWKEFEWKELKE